MKWKILFMVFLSLSVVAISVALSFNALMPSEIWTNENLKYALDGNGGLVPCRPIDNPGGP